MKYIMKKKTIEECNSKGKVYRRVVVTLECDQVTTQIKFRVVWNYWNDVDKEREFAETYNSFVGAEEKFNEIV